MNDCLVSHADLVPTVLSECEIGAPDRLHGVDISTLVDEGREPVREGLAFQFYSSNWGERPTPLRGWRTPSGGSTSNRQTVARSSTTCWRTRARRATASTTVSPARALQRCVQACGPGQWGPAIPWPSEPMPKRVVRWEPDDRWGGE